MKKNLSKVLLGLSAALLPDISAQAQITILKDYQNNYSAPIGKFQNVNFREAGFSGLYPVVGTNGKEFWTVSDRGVNVDAANANKTATPNGTVTCKPTYDKIYGFPTYAPKIHRIRLNGDSVQILNSISLKRPDGTTATGLLNPTGFGSTAAELISTDTVKNCVNFSTKTFPKDIWGIDSEGIAVDKEGNFWVCEEGGPTIWKLNSFGKVVKRYTPYANLVGAQTQDVAIDTVFKYRKNNRGFEGITITPNGKVYAIIQSPVLYPTTSIGEATQIHRIIEIDPVTNQTRMFAYLNDGIIGASGSNQIRLKDWKIGDMAAINDSTFLVMEAALRGTSDFKRIYKININQATAVTSGLYNGKTLEALVDATGLTANSIKPVNKTLFMDLLANGWPSALEKAEGLAILNDSTIAIGNDNDYGQTTLNAAEDGIAVPTSNLSHVIVYRLSGANKIPYFTTFSPLLAQGQTGPSTSQTPYMLPSVPSASFTSVLTAGDQVNGYKLAGLGDGLGAFDNGNGTFTLLMNHEMSNTVGVTRAHGQKGAFVSKWVINKNDLNVLSGSDLVQNVKLWNGTSYSTFNTVNTSTLAAFNRFCAADLPSVSAFYNAKTGLGTQEKLFMNGEESGSEGRAFAHIVTGTEAGTTYELPKLGKFSWENSIACPSSGNKTVVVGLDDATPGQVYVYVGTKTNSGNEVEKAGLTNGKLYGVAVSGLAAETSTFVPAANTAFSLVDLGNVENITGATLNTNSNNAGVTAFLRPEDGAWDPIHPNDFYFATTNAFTAPSRLWKLHLTDVLNPELGGTITAVLDGTEGQKMLDNLTIDNSGNVLLQEDPGNQAHIAKVWQYTPSTDALVQVAEHDPARFTIGASNFLTIDEESSGIIDVQNILGAGKFMLYQQAHYAFGNTEIVEGGQLLAFYNPTTANFNPEIDVKGNAVSIVNGDATPSLTDNTNFGAVSTGNNVTKNFVIENTGTGTLYVTDIQVTGVNASEFTVIGSSNFTVAPSGTKTVTVQFAPTATGTRTATMNIVNTDFSESNYSFKLEGTGNVATGIQEIDGFAGIQLFPNPAKNEAKVTWFMNQAQDIEINVYDMQGKLALKPISKQYSVGTQQVSISTEELMNGIYFIQLKSEGKSTQLKMVVIH